MATLEGGVQTSIRDMLNRHGFWALKMQIIAIAGYPDLFCFGKGRAFLIEVKQGQNKPRGLQRLRQRNLNKAGIACEWFSTVDDAEAWLIKQEWYGG